jgi:hypothetical protein
MKYSVHFFFFLFSLTSLTWSQDMTSDLLNSGGALSSSINHKTKSSWIDDIKNRIYFNYNLFFLGPSLSSDYQSNATFNRFKTGKDLFDNDLDYTGSYQAFHATSLGFRLRDNMFLSYNYSFQDDMFAVNYQEKNWDGTSSKGTRQRGLSYNNQQVNLWISGVGETRYFYYNLGLTYERPTTEISEQNEMLYGAGMTHNINFKSWKRGLFTGFNFNFQRDFYKRDQYDFFFEDGTKGMPTQMQTMRVSFNPYLIYSLTDKINFRKSLDFDWDQKGNEVYTSKFRPNMIDVGNIGLQYFASRQVILGSNIQYALVDPSIEKSALILSMTLML